MASQGPNDPTSGTNDAGIGALAWTDPGNITSSDDAYATATTSLDTTNYLVASGYGFTIPADATINGIVVEIERNRFGSQVIDNSVVLWAHGAPFGGDNKASGANWPTTDTYATYGTSTDFWGAPIAPADVNGADFGAAIAVDITSATASVDHIRMTIYYTEANTTAHVVAGGRLLW